MTPWYILIAVDSDEQTSFAVIERSVYDRWNEGEIDTDHNDLFGLMNSEHATDCSSYADCIYRVAAQGGQIDDIIAGLAY